MLKLILKKIKYLLISVFKFLKKEGYVLVPTIKNQESLSDLLYKISYMLPEQKVFYSGLPKSKAKKPTYLGEIELSDKIYHTRFIKIMYLCLTFRNILLWANSNKELIQILTRFPNVFNIDRKRSEREGWAYFSAYNYTLNEGRNPKPLDLSNFKKRDKCYVFGTGESLNTAYNYNFEDGYRIVCNTMIKNIPLMRHIQPDFLLFADAIYHFGPSLYAFEFRKALKKFVDIFKDCKILIPGIFYHHFIRLNPGLKEFVYCIPFCGSKEININLKQKYCTHDFGNVLNLLMLPLSSTLSDNIYFLGFDGRKENDEKFWSYSKENNFCDLLYTQELAHPGFFTGRDYKSYSKKLSLETELIMQYGERTGKSYYCLSNSNHQAMKKRVLRSSAPGEKNQ